MREIIPDLKKWLADNRHDIALATIVETRGSALRPAGTRMAITLDGAVTGSVSSGCIDGDVIAEMEMVLRGEGVIRRPNFGVSDEKAWSAGLACGGELDLLIERWDPVYESFMAEVEARRPVGLAVRMTLTEPRHLLRTAAGQILGTLGDPALDAAVLADLTAAWPGPLAEKRRYPQGEVFLEVAAPLPTLLIFGATDIAVPLSRMALALGWEVVVSDARRAFLRPERFEGAQIRLGWPQDMFSAEEMGTGWAVVVLFHDPKFDVPALSLALRSQAFYIGYLGSKRTQAERRGALQSMGFGEADLARIYGPVGLDLGGRETGAIALSILSEVMAVRNRREGGMLSRRPR